MDPTGTRRRDFLKALGLSLGGATLAVGCGDDNRVSGPTPPFANAFRFHPVKSTNANLPGGGSIERFRFDTVIDAQGDVLYGVIDGNDRPGIYGFHLDFSGTAAPSVSGERKLAREGDVLPDGHHIHNLLSYDVNAEGACVIVLEVDTEIVLDGGQPYTTEIVYRGFQESALQPILAEGFITTDNHKLEGHFGDIDTHTGHDILLVARYLHHHSADSDTDNDAPDTRHLEGIFLLPAGNPAQARLVVNHEDLIGNGDLVGGFGLIDLHDGGHYVAQAHPARTHDSTASLRTDADLGLGSRIFRGHIHQPRRATPITSTRPSPRTALLGQVTGDAAYGPRLGPDQRTAFVLHTTDTATALYYHGLRVVESGERSGAGNLVRHITPPVFGPDGEIYFVLITTAGHELYVSNGEHTALLLKSGDQLVGDARKVALIALGHTTEHVDAEGRMVFVTTFDDESEALVVGIPV